MANKDFNLVVKAILNSAGFTSGKDKITADAKELERSVTAGNNIMRDSFGELTNEALPNLSQQFGVLKIAGEGIRQAFTKIIPAAAGAKKVIGAMMTGGVALIITVVTTAIAGLIAWMKRTDEGGDKMRNVFNYIKAVIEVLLTKLAALGGAIVKLFSGDFKGAWQDAKSAFTGWGDAIKENVQSAKQLNAEQDKLEEFNVTYQLKRAEIERKIADLQLKARDEEYGSATERLEAVKELEKQKTNLYNLDRKQLQLEVNIAQKQYDQGAKNEDTLTALNNKKAELIRLDSEHLQELREIVKLETKLRDDVEEETLFKNKGQQKVETVDVSRYNVVKIAMNEVIKKNVELNNTLRQTKTILTDTEKFWYSYANGSISAITMMKGQFKSAWKEMANQVIDFGTMWRDVIITGIQDFGTMLGESLAGGKDSWKDYVATMIQATNQIVQMYLAQSLAGIMAGESKKGLLGVVLGMAGAALVTAFFSSQIKKFATGGLMPTSGYALVGEQGPELAYLNKGTRIYNNFQTRNLLGNNEPKQVEFMIKDRYLVGIQNNYYRRNKSYK